MISCLTVTREGKIAELRRALRCFDRQTFEQRELLVLHDGSAELDREIRAAAALYPRSEIRVERAETGHTLGALRNQSLELARHDVVCQWDDDDLYHPRRLEIQFGELERAAADFCFFTDQLHWFEQNGEMYWDDWMVERFPLCLIQGTLMGDRSKLGRYPEVARGEDTSVVLDLIRSGRRVAPLQDRGYLYIYVFNGRNAWGISHHAAISEWKRRDGARLLEHEETLRRHLAEYEIEGVAVSMPHEGGALRFALDSRS